MTIVLESSSVQQVMQISYANIVRKFKVNIQRDRSPGKDGSGLGPHERSDRYSSFTSPYFGVLPYV